MLSLKKNKSTLLDSDSFNTSPLKNQTIKFNFDTDNIKKQRSIEISEIDINKTN